jgi:hypothetical protein
MNKTQRDVAEFRREVYWAQEGINEILQILSKRWDIEVDSILLSPIKEMGKAYPVHYITKLRVVM